MGDRFTDGFEILRLNGDQEGVLEAIKPVGGRGLRLLGAFVAGPDRSTGAIQYIDGYPPRHPELDATIVPAIGAKIVPRSVEPTGSELLVGFEVTRPGRLVRDGLLIVYRVGDQHFVQALRAVLVVCTEGFRDARGQCPPPHEKSG